jgi:dTDP-4-dehydrorhamnose 3,5-epimerase
MKLSETPLLGAFEIEIEEIEDERGFFARTWDKNEFIKRNLDSEFVQSNISFNKKKGTIRGMHYQSKPYEETKIIRCTKGAIYDVIIDLRPNSLTFKEWFATELTENNHKILYIPKGFAHGYQTMEDNSEVSYQVSQYYNANYSEGVRWNDKTFEIKWPLEVTSISQKDLTSSFFSKLSKEVKTI